MQIKFDFNLSDYTIRTVPLEEKEFIESFKTVASDVNKVIQNAHTDVLKQWNLFPPQNQREKAVSLNSRIQKFISDEFSHFEIQNKYDSISVHISPKFWVMFKKVGSNLIPRFKDTKRAISRISQCKFNENLEVPSCIVIGYEVTEDYQDLLNVFAIKLEIDLNTRNIKIDWYIPFSEIIDSSVVPNRTVQNDLKILMPNKKGLPIIKKKAQ